MVPPRMRRVRYQEGQENPRLLPQDLLPAAPQASESETSPSPQTPISLFPFPWDTTLPHREGQPGSRISPNHQRRRKGQGAWMVRDRRARRGQAAPTTAGSQSTAPSNAGPPWGSAARTQHLHLAQGISPCWAWIQPAMSVHLGRAGEEVPSAQAWTGPAPSPAMPTHPWTAVQARPLPLPQTRFPVREERR